MISGARTPLTVDLTGLRVAITAGANGIGKVMADHGPTIAEEVLARSLDAGDGTDAPALAGFTTDVDIEGHAVTLGIERA